MWSQLLGAVCWSRMFSFFVFTHPRRPTQKFWRPLTLPMARSLKPPGHLRVFPQAVLHPGRIGEEEDRSLPSTHMLGVLSRSIAAAPHRQWQLSSAGAVNGFPRSRFSRCPLLVVGGFLGSPMSGNLDWFSMRACKVFCFFSLVPNGTGPLLRCIQRCFLDLRRLGPAAGRHCFSMALQGPAPSSGACEDVHVVPIAGVVCWSPFFCFYSSERADSEILAAAYSPHGVL